MRCNALHDRLIGGWLRLRQAFLQRRQFCTFRVQVDGDWYGGAERIGFIA